VLWYEFLPLSMIFLSVRYLIMKRMLKQWLTTISSLSIKPTIIFHIKLLNTNKTTTYVIEITGPRFGWHKRLEEYNRLMGSRLHVLLNLFFRSIWVHFRFLVGLSGSFLSNCCDHWFLFVIFILAIVSSVLLWFTGDDYLLLFLQFS
jgi:hypothetical protein